MTLIKSYKIDGYTYSLYPIVRIDKHGEIFTQYVYFILYVFDKYDYPIFAFIIKRKIK